MFHLIDVYLLDEQYLVKAELLVSSALGEEGWSMYQKKRLKKFKRQITRRLLIRKKFGSNNASKVRTNSSKINEI